MTDKQAPQNTPDEIDEILLSYGRHIVQSMKPENFGNNEHFNSEKEAKTKLNALITVARIDELERLDKTPKKNLDVYWNHRIKELQSTLTNDKIGGGEDQ